MTVTLTATGKTMEVNACYGARLVEQGKAAVCRKPAKTRRKGGRKNGTG